MSSRPTASPHTPLLALAGLTLAFGASAAALAPTAEAGTISVKYCAFGHSMSEDWTVINNFGAGSDNAHDGCTDQSDVAVIDWATATDRRSGARTGWQLDTSKAPELAIVGWNAQASAAIHSNMTNAVLSGVSDGSVLCGAGNCDQAYGGQTPNAFRSTKIDWTLSCDAQAAGLANCSGSASTRLSGNTVTFEDGAPPTGTVSGPLTSTSDSNPASGTQVPIHITAADRGTGVLAEEVLVDGQSAAKQLDRCMAPFARMQPCPTTDTVDLVVNTTEFSDGVHKLTVDASDASGNKTVIYQAPFVIRNQPSSTPPGGASNGAPASASAKLTAWWPATAKKPSKVTAVRLRCKRSSSYARSHHTLCKGRPAGTSLHTAYSAARKNLIRGRLVTPAGAPIAGATVQIAGPAPTTAKTDATGRFAASVPVRTGSGRLVVSWASHVGDANPAATSVLRRYVRATTTVKATRRGRTVTASGALRGSAGAPKGTTVVVQTAGRTGAWHTLRTGHADSKGRWAVRGRATAGRASRLRVRITPSKGYPYDRATSSATRIASR